MKYVCPFCYKTMPEGYEPSGWSCCGEVGHATILPECPKCGAESLELPFAHCAVCGWKSEEYLRRRDCRPSTPMTGGDQWYARERAAFIAWWESEGEKKFSETPTMAAGAGWFAKAEAASDIFRTCVGDSLEVLDAIRGALEGQDRSQILELVNGYIDRAKADLTKER